VRNLERKGRRRDPRTPSVNASVVLEMTRRDCSSVRSETRTEPFHPMPIGTMRGPQDAAIGLNADVPSGIVRKFDSTMYGVIGRATKESDQQPP
jgi:hypothetical protein